MIEPTRAFSATLRVYEPSEKYGELSFTSSTEMVNVVRDVRGGDPESLAAIVTVYVEIVSRSNKEDKTNEFDEEIIKGEPILTNVNETLEPRPTSGSTVRR